MKKLNITPGKLHIALILIILAITALSFYKQYQSTKPVHAPGISNATSASKPAFVIADSVPASPSITTDATNLPTVDFGQCAAGSFAQYSSFGSYHYVITGKEGNACVLYMGGETENPQWDRKLTERCEVPTSFGKVANGFVAISTYCKTPK